MTTTHRELIDEITSCTTKEQAAALVATLTREMLAAVPNITESGAKHVTLSTIGYMTGYLSRPEAGRLLALFETNHPYFGSI